MDNLPKKNVVFTLEEVVTFARKNKLGIYLGFVPPVRTNKCKYKFQKPSTVEYEHIGLDALLALPGWAKTEWRFLQLSDLGENLCFIAVSSEEISALCDFEANTSSLLEDYVCSFPLGTDFVQSPPYNPSIHGYLLDQ